MNKSERILFFWLRAIENGVVPSTSAIAERVGCRPEYVRVVARQRKGGTESEYERRYRLSIAAHANKDAARKAGRLAYKQARLSGHDVALSTTMRTLAYMKVIRQTGQAARKAHQRVSCPPERRRNA